MNLQRFGSFIFTVRKQKRITRKALAKSCKISSPTFRKLEAGLTEPTARGVIEIARHLSLEASELLGLLIDDNDTEPAMVPLTVLEQEVVATIPTVNQFEQSTSETSPEAKSLPSSLKARTRKTVVAPSLATAHRSAPEPLKLEADVSKLIMTDPAPTFTPEVKPSRSVRSHRTIVPKNLPLTGLDQNFKVDEGHIDEQPELIPARPSKKPSASQDTAETRKKVRLAEKEREILVGQRVNALRRSQKVSLEELSQRTGLITESLKRLEAGRRLRNQENALQLIAEALQMNVEFLTGSNLQDVHFQFET